MRKHHRTGDTFWRRLRGASKPAPVITKEQAAALAEKLRLAREEDEADEAMDNGRNTGGRSYR